MIPTLPALRPTGARAAADGRAPRALRIAWPAITVLVALAALLVALAIGGGADSAGGPQSVAVRYGLPVAQLLLDLAAAATVGPLVLATVALSPADARWNRLLDVVAAGAGVWAITAGTLGFLFYLNDAAVGDAAFGPGFIYYLSAVAGGQVWLAATVAAALLTVLAISVRSHTGVALVTVAAVAALTPIALQGHAASASPAEHGEAIVAFGLHIVGAAAWLGGLAALLVLGARMRGAALADLVSRYSSVALVCFVVVSVSGVLSAAIRLLEPANLLTPYGVLVLVKSAALVVAGVLGALYRIALIPRIATGPGRRPFLAVVAGELVILGVASGFAAGLAFSAPPDGHLAVPTTPAELLTGAPLPPPMTLGTLLTTGRPDVLWALLCAFLVVVYLAGVRRLRARGERWPVRRTGGWLAGVALLLWLTEGGPAVYQGVLLSADLLLHLALAVLVPLLLVPAAPGTLALRAIHPRADGTRGGREWILLVVRSRAGAALAHPIVAAALFALSPVVFSASPAFRWAATDHLGHEAVSVGFLVIGCLFVWSMIGSDPVPVRLRHPTRLLVLLGAALVQVVFGLWLLVGRGLLLADWFGAMGWGTSALADQRAGAAVVWSIEGLGLVVLAACVAVDRSRRADREPDGVDHPAVAPGDADAAARERVAGPLQRTGA